MTSQLQRDGERLSLLNFGEHLLCPSALLARSKLSKFAASFVTLLEHKICCQNSTHLTARRLQPLNYGISL